MPDPDDMCFSGQSQKIRLALAALVTAGQILQLPPPPVSRLGAKAAGNIVLHQGLVLALPKHRTASVGQMIGGTDT